MQTGTTLAPLTLSKLHFRADVDGRINRPYFNEAVRRLKESGQLPADAEVLLV